MPDKKKKVQAGDDGWTKLAAGLGKVQNPLKVPYDVALKEASQAAVFVSTYWDKTETRPGLARVKARLPKSTGEDILSLVEAVQTAQTKVLMLTDPSVMNRGARARLLVDTLESSLEFLLDDGVEEPADDQLAQIQQFHAQDGQRSGALAQALADYGALAASLKDRLVEVDEEFDPKLIDEAKSLAAELFKNPPAAVPSAPSEEVTNAVLLRNQLLTLLTQKVSAVRKAAAHVFKDHPEVLREVTSTYERRRRAARRLKLAKEAEAKAKEGEAKKSPA